jgi:hypothetical protein
MQETPFTDPEAKGAPEPEIGELTSDEFRTLMQSLTDVAQINRHVRTFKVPAYTEFATVLRKLEPLVDRMPKWSGLTHFAAEIAEAAEDKRSALVLYDRVKKGGESPVKPEVLEAKLEELRQVSRAEIAIQAEFATEELNKLFGLTLPPPRVDLLDTDSGVYDWDGTTIKLPAGIEDIPDVIVRVASYPFISKLLPLKGQGETLASSYLDVLTSIVKQARLHQTAAQADWTIAPGGKAWVEGKTRVGGQDQTPWWSMKAPGTAFSGDPQPAHYRDLVTSGVRHG